MKRWVFSAPLAALLVAAPSAGQDAPKSLLPDVFGAPPPEAAPPPTPARPDAETAEPGMALPAAAPGADLPPPVAAPAVPTARDPLASEPSTTRSLDIVGPLPARLGGFGMRAFAGSDGRFLSEVIGRIDPPLASRWGHIVLRRALLSRVPTPAGVRPADWVAARALLLLRMGEVDGAKLLVDSLPLDRYTPRLYGVASQVHLAAADIPAICPLTPSAKGFSKDPLWDLANAVCAGLDGDDITAAGLFDRMRAQRLVPIVDIVLAERVATVLTGEGRGANVAWEAVDRINAYRFGLATAAGIEIPAELIDRPGVALTGWLTRAPGVAASRRAGIAPRAAAFGIASAGELAAIAAMQIASLDPDDDGGDALADMRAAFAGRTNDERIAAMRRVWAAGTSPLDRYGRIVATADAAARVMPDAGNAGDAAALIASMLSAGRTRAALAWWPVLAGADQDDRIAAWPYLALVDRSGSVPVSTGRGKDWRDAVKRLGGDADRKAALFGAAMDALGKPGDWAGFAGNYGYQRLDNSYTRRLGAAASARRRGEVALLVGLGLQSDWPRVSPGQLGAIVGALDHVGFRNEARLLAVEALTRN
jgi:hypothetical protein